MGQNLQVYEDGRQREVGRENPLPVVDRSRGRWVAVGFETLSVGTTAVTFNPAVYQPAGGDLAERAELGPVETAPCRYRYDGPSPTSSVGHLIDVGNTLQVEGQALREFRIIASTAVTASIPVTYLTWESYE